MMQEQTSDRVGQNLVSLSWILEQLFSSQSLINYIEHLNLDKS